MLRIQVYIFPLMVNSLFQTIKFFILWRDMSTCNMRENEDFLKKKRRENEEVRCHWAHDLYLVFERLEFFECLYSYGKSNIFILFKKKKLV